MRGVRVGCAVRAVKAVHEIAYTHKHMRLLLEDLLEPELYSHDR